MLFDIFISIILGAIFGSFSTFIGFRLFNEDESIKITGKRSICCNCKHKLCFIDLIPILSFIALRGKCRYCNKNIPSWHFFAEVFMIICFVLATIYFKGIDQKTTLLWLICFCLITQSIIDFRVMMSSDVIHLITFISIVILSILLGKSQIQIVLTPIIVLSIFILLSGIMKKILKRECLGYGDIKLFVILSPIFDIEKLPLFFGLCGCFGIFFVLIKFVIYKKKIQFLDIKYNKSKPFPFIPSIFLAFLLAFYF